MCVAITLVRMVVLALQAVMAAATCAFALVATLVISVRMVCKQHEYRDYYIYNAIVNAFKTTICPWV